MKYRIAKFEDSLIEKIVLMWRPSKRLAFGQDDIHSFEEDVEYLKNVLSKNNTIQLAIESENNKIIGMIAFTENTISQLYVDVDYINQGIGSVLLDLAKKQSIDKLELFTYQRNEIARKFYEKHGFVEIGRNYENELNLPDIKYRWRKKLDL